MLGQVITNLAVPVRAIIAGSPVLARRLAAPAARRREKRAAEHAKTVAAREKKLAKLSGDALQAAKAKYAEQDKETPGERRSVGDIIGVSALVLLGFGPFIWGHVKPLVPWVVSAAIALWSVAAMVHAPPAGEQPTPAESGDGEQPAAAEQDEPGRDADPEADDEGEWLQEAPAPDVLWALIRHTAALTRQGTAAHLQAVLEQGVKRGQFTGWTVTDLGDELADLKVRVVEGKKLTIGRKDFNRKAVLLSDLPEADPAPVPALVLGAGQEVA